MATTELQVYSVDELKVTLFREQYKQLTSFLGDEEKARKFLGAVVYCFSSVPALETCGKESIVQAFMQCAELNLFPSTISGDAYVLPYKGKAQFQLGYKGIVKLLSRSGIVVINSGIIKKNDEYDVQEGTSPHIVHKIPMEGDRGEPISVYVVAKFQGETVFKNMRSGEVLEFKKFSQSASGKYPQYSPWDISKDPELWMWRKTCLKQLAKTLPLNEETAKAIALDNEEGSITEYQKTLYREAQEKDTGFRVENIVPTESLSTKPTENE